MLDGLEPLQHGPGPVVGELKDPGIRALLRGLAAKNAGLCLVTTRETASDLAGRKGAAEWQLESLSREAGVELLKSLKVTGSLAELRMAVEEVRGHALTLNLLGRYLAGAHGGDVRQRDLVGFEEADAEIRGGHAFRVIGAYERWLEAEGVTGRRDLGVLRLLGLFDRPADAGCLGVLRKKPAISGLTEALVMLTEPQWNLSLTRLAEAHLIVKGEDGGIDAHPLLREYFGRRLREVAAEAWREAHGRLFDFLKESAEHQPGTLAGLQPLYQAVYHGCQAGRQEEARAEVYRDRILRGAEAFVVHKLGAFGADLGAVACFFEVPWSRVSSSLSEANQGWLLNEAAFRLRALGRLREAAEPMRAGLEAAVRLENWGNAAWGASNLSELELTLGEVKAAVADAEQSVVFADRSGAAFLRLAFRATLADAWHQAGDEGAALALFREAERLQAERQPGYPLLYSLRGFQYCDLLVARAERAAGSGRDARAPSLQEECAEVERRATQTLEWVTSQNWLLDIALDHLSLGRARLFRAILDGRASQVDSDARAEIEEAVAGLRASGQQIMLPRGLLTRAWLRFVDGDASGTRADLDEAYEIAERGSMRLYLADVALYRARFFHDRAALAEARRLIDECGYGRRLPELADLEKILGSS